MSLSSSYFLISPARHGHHCQIRWSEGGAQDDGAFVDGGTGGEDTVQEEDLACEILRGGLLRARASRKFSRRSLRSSSACWGV